MYKNIIVTENQNEDDWRCDVCVSKEEEETNPLYICELCQVVVHLSCYMRDLVEEYDKDLEDKPWYCSRCKYLLIDNTPIDLVPYCSLCP